MQALGLIETKGLLAAIEAADTMVKSADVSIVEKTYVGGGLVTISITGDVGAVKASVEAGAAAIRKIDEKFLISQHVIPRPHEELKSIIGPNDPEDDPVSNKEIENEDNAEIVEEVKNVEEVKDIQEVKDEDDLDNIENTEKVKNVEKIEENVPKNQNALDSGKTYKVNLENLRKDDVDSLVSKNGMEKTISILSKLRVVKLRNLAREYKDFIITGRAISRADKNLLIAKFKLYYEKK